MTDAERLAKAKQLYIDTMARSQREAYEQAEAWLSKRATPMRLRQMQTAKHALDRAEADAAAIFEHTTAQPQPPAAEDKAGG